MQLVHVLKTWLCKENQNTNTADQMTWKTMENQGTKVPKLHKPTFPAEVMQVIGSATLVFWYFGFPGHGVCSFGTLLLGFPFKSTMPKYKSCTDLFVHCGK